MSFSGNRNSPFVPTALIGSMFSFVIQSKHSYSKWQPATSNRKTLLFLFFLHFVPPQRSLLSAKIAMVNPDGRLNPSASRVTSAI